MAAKTKSVKFQKPAARASAFASDAASDAASAFASAAASASAASAARSSAVSAARASAASAANKGAYNAVFGDANSGLSAAALLSQPLWADGMEPKWLAGRRARSEDLLTTDPDFEFWARWYDGHVKGEPMDWELQSRVALIDPDIWNEGARDVAAQIARIEADYLAEQTQQSEQVQFNQGTGKFQVVPAPLENAGFIGTILSQTEDALDDVLNGNNGLREDMSLVKKLRRTHARYSNDPQRIEMDYTSVAIALRREIHKTGELASSDDNLALLEAVEEGALAVRANHPEVAANRNRLAAQKMREMSGKDVELLTDALPILENLSEGLMQEDFKRDIPQLLNDATLPLPGGAPPLPGADEATRIFYRVSRMQQIYQQMTDKGAAVFDSKSFKTVRLGLTVGDALASLVRLGLKLFGII